MPYDFLHYIHRKLNQFSANFIQKSFEATRCRQG